MVCGHTHLPFLRLVDGRLVVNLGSVGLPYGRPGAHGALPVDGRVSFRRAAIDPDALARELAAGSSVPGVEALVSEYIRTPASDREAPSGPVTDADAGLPSGSPEHASAEHRSVRGWFLSGPCSGRLEHAPRR